MKQLAQFSRLTGTTRLGVSLFRDKRGYTIARAPVIGLPKAFTPSLQEAADDFLLQYFSARKDLGATPIKVANRGTRAAIMNSEFYDETVELEDEE